MSDTVREMLARLLLEHEAESDPLYGVACGCGQDFRSAIEHREHVAELIEAAFLVIPHSEIHGTQYGVRYTTQWGENVAVQADKAQALRRAPELAAQYPSLTVDAVERPVPPWSAIPLPKDGQR